MTDWINQRITNSQRRALGNAQLLEPWALEPQLGLDVFGQPVPYVDLSGTDVVAQELNRLLAPVPAVAAALGWAQQQTAPQVQDQPTQQLTQPQIPSFSPPPQLQGLSLIHI